MLVDIMEIACKKLRNFNQHNPKLRKKQLARSG